MSNLSKTGHPSSWLALGCIILLQAVGGNPSIFSFCSSLMEQHYHVSYVQLNILVFATEIGRQFGCLISSAAANYLPLWMTLFIGLIFGSIGYGVQYLCIQYNVPSLTYWQLLLLNVLAGNSYCWFDTYCHSLAATNFKDGYRTVVEVTSSYSGLSSKVYTAIIEAIQGKKLNSQDSHSYLLLTCLAPVILGLPVIVILNLSLTFMECGGHDNVLPAAFAIAIVTGACVIIESLFSQMSIQLRGVILAFVLMLPFAVALTMAAYQFTTKRWYAQVRPEVSIVYCNSTTSKRVDKVLEIAVHNVGDEIKANDREGKENGLEEKPTNLDFVLFYLVNACGATMATVYLNNLGQISASLTDNEASLLLAISSVFGFFGRVFAVLFDWYTREKPIIQNTALTVLLMIPMPIAFFLLIIGSHRCLYISTGILGTCAGALNAISSSTICELFGSENSILRRAILVSNIPLGSLLFGCLAARLYELEATGDDGICMGRQCFYKTFVIWGFVCLVGASLSFVLHLRRQKSYSPKC